MYKSAILERSRSYFNHVASINSVFNSVANATEVFVGNGDFFRNNKCKLDIKSIPIDTFIPPFSSVLLSWYEEKTFKASLYIKKESDAISLWLFCFFNKYEEWRLYPWSIDLVPIENNFSVNIKHEIDHEANIDNCTLVEPMCFYAKTLFDALSCKNVSLTPVDPPAKLNKKRIKKGKQPLYRYHVLTVDLDKGRKQSGVGRGANLGTMPVHLCRGHFKEYTDEKPLFGRITGRFWWQPCARGKAENGVVMKDYELKHNNV